MEIFFFFIGILFAYTYKNTLLIFLLCFFYIIPRFKFLVFFIIGLAFAFFHQWYVSPSGMTNKLVLSNAVLVGTIISLPINTKQKAQFLFEVSKINEHKTRALIQLSWYFPNKPLITGEKWQFVAKIKQPRNFNNPGSFDYVTSLAKKHVYWTGYIRKGNNKRLQRANTFSLDKKREQLVNQIALKSPNQRTAGIIAALTLNSTKYINPEDWDLFRRTGTVHLFGISGEHVALFSGLFFFITRRLWSLSTNCCLFIPAPTIASIIGLSVAFFYALLAGFEPPVQRALVGCFFYMFSYLGIQRFSPWQVWRYALLIVLCIEPHAVFMQGFYFSFLAVVCLLLTHQRWNLRGIKGNLALQLSCLFGLMPLSLYWFSYGSFNGFLANVFAIPLVGFIIIPLSLLFLCIAWFSWSWVVMMPLSYSIDLLYSILKWTEYLAVVNINWSINEVYWVVALMGSLLLILLLPIKSLRLIIVLWLILPFFPSKNLIHTGDALVHILDVGQGLAIHVQTRHHVLLYDTGDQFYQGSDLGGMVILPFYKAMGISTVDVMVISHPDKDHLGGMKTIEAALPVKQLVVNDPSFYQRGFNCHQYSEWEWDGVYFRFFPLSIPFKNKNNNSCILQVRSQKSSILLSGDIEKEAEDYLIKTYGEELKSDVLVLPHHASKTSSSYRFLLDVAPQYAIASLGFDNRFRFPHQKTIRTLAHLKIPFYRTDACGMTEIKLTSFPLSAPKCYKKA